MNAVEIEEAVSALAEQPFDPAEFPFAFLQAQPRLVGCFVQAACMRLFRLFQPSDFGAIRAYAPPRLDQTIASTSAGMSAQAVTIIA